VVHHKPLDIAQIVPPRFAEEHQRTATQDGELERIDLTLKGENFYRAWRRPLAACGGSLRCCSMARGRLVSSGRRHGIETLQGSLHL
jgi:hypothetical protein